MTIPPYNVQIPFTKSDALNFRSDAKPCEAIFVGTAGDMAVVSPNGTVVTWSGVVGGALYPISAVRINSTNTTASGFVALYTN